MTNIPLQEDITSNESEAQIIEESEEKSFEHFGEYRLISELGSGSYSYVYLARDRLDRLVALKILKKQYSFNEEFLEHFQREAVIAAALNHEHIVTIYNQGDYEGQFFIAMEYAPEGTLREYLNQSGGINRTEIKEFIKQIAEALDFAHSNNVVHRDIKPSNILLGHGYKIKVTDFGIARAEHSGTVGVTNTVRGTYAYMAPEQANPSIKVDGRADVYSLAVVVFEMLCGSLPFDDSGGDFATLIANKRNGQIISLDASKIPGYVTKVIFDALKPQPDFRPRTAGQFANRLLQAFQQWEQSTAENRDRQDLSGLAFLAMEQKKWNEAKLHWESLLRFGTSPLAESNLAIVKREIDLQNAWTRVAENFDKGKWQDVIDALNEILKINPNDSDAPAKLEEAHQQIRWQRLYEDGEDAFSKEDYTVAVEKFTEIFEVNPEYRDVKNRLEQFRQTQTKDELNRVREKLLLALAEGDLDVVKQHTKKILELAPQRQYGVESFLKRIDTLIEKITKERSENKSLILNTQNTLKETKKQNDQLELQIAELKADLKSKHDKIVDQQDEIEAKKKQISSLSKELINRLYDYLKDLDRTIAALHKNIVTRTAAKDLIEHLRARIVEIAARGEQLEDLENKE